MLWSFNHFSTSSFDRLAVPFVPAFMVHGEASVSALGCRASSASARKSSSRTISGGTSGNLNYAGTSVGPVGNIVALTGQAAVELRNAGRVEDGLVDADRVRLEPRGDGLQTVLD